MKLRALLLAFLFPLFLCAGNGDTLETYLKSVPRDTAAVNKLMAISEKLSRTDEDAARRVAEEALAIAKETGDKPSVALAMLTLGVRYMNEGDYVKSSQFLFPSMTTADSIGNNTIRLRVMNSLGNLYARQNQFKEAEGYYEKALALARAVHNRDKEGMILGNLGNIYYLQSEGDSTSLDKSIFYYQQALKISREDNAVYREINALNNLTLVYGDKKLYAQALAVCDTLLALITAHRDSVDLVYLYVNYARIYRYQGDYANAIANFNRSLLLAQTLGMKDMIAEDYHSLAICYSLTGDYKKAYEYQDKYTDLQNSLVNTENTQIISDLKNKIRTQEKENVIASLKQRNEVADLRNSRQNIYLGVSIAGVLIFIVLAFLFFTRARMKEEANRRLGQQNDVIAQKNKEITSSIQYAQRIQQTLLASEDSLRSRLGEFFIFYRPKDIVSGDFYWATERVETGGNRAERSPFWLAVCDSTGHGVPGAFMSLLNISFLNEAISEKGMSAPGDVFGHARKRLIESISQEGAQDGMDGTLFVFEGNRLRYAAAHNAPVVFRNGVMMELSCDKMPVGKSPHEQTPFTTFETELRPGDVVYAFTDGYADQFGGHDGKKFKYKNLLKLLGDTCHLPMAEQKKLLEKKYDEWKGALEQVDDVLVVGFRA
ncbi:MAG TPA: tetratricopeptide repeat protein [Bacteroidia bacterium]|nr:tetratricopeptide repeat protein [Bacteroidia bacterium]